MQARSTGEPELLQAQRRRREQRETDRPASARRVRRRRQSIPWLQRNALSVAAVSVLVAFLGLGFGLLQMLNHPEGSGGLSPSQSDSAAAASSSVLQAATVGGGVAVGELTTANNVPSPGQRAIHASAKVIEPNYTVASGDTLVKIATKFNTSVDRIQAFNNLSDPRVLRIGTKLVIPPPL
jgi:LysM repeat protein